MKTIAASITPRVFFAAVLLLTSSQLRAAEARQNGANDESEPIQLVYVAGQVKIPQRKFILVHEANPAFTLPRSTGFVARMKKVPFKVSTSLVHDETSALCDLLIPNLTPSSAGMTRVRRPACTASCSR